MLYNTSTKLVRDKIPLMARESEKEDGWKLPYTFGLLDPKDERSAVEQYGLKVVEEAREVYLSLRDFPNCDKYTIVTRKRELTEEMGDLMEILETIAHKWGIEWEEVVKAQKKKAEARGGFGLGAMLVEKEGPVNILPFPYEEDAML